MCVTAPWHPDCMSAAPGGLVPPLYLHSSLHTTPRGRLSESGPEMEWEHRMAQVSRNQVRAALALARPCTFCSSEA